MELYVVTVDLLNPKVKVRVCPGGPDPDGDGPWETTLMKVKEIAQRDHLTIATNASYFNVPKQGDRKIAEEEAEKSGKPSVIPLDKSGYVEGQVANDNGVTIAEGKHWGVRVGTGNAPTIWVTPDRKVQIGTGNEVPRDATAAVSGNVFVLKNGEVVPEKANAAVRHPRTVVGLNKEGTKLVIMAVDGRMISSVGMTGTDMGNEMKRLGCDTAINLDGGGSTTLVMKEPGTEKYDVINKPSDGHERSVADALGVSVEE